MSKGLGTALTVLLLVAAAAVVVAAHWPALSVGALCFDDHDFLTANPLVRNPGWDSASRFFREVLAPSTVPGYYIPLAMVSLMFDAAGGATQENLVPIHRTSLLLHVATTLLAIVLLRQLCGRFWPALVAGLLFGLHPLTVEPVAWVAERKTVLAGFFAMVTLVLYVRAVRQRERLSFAGAVVAYALALLSKPTVLPLPVILVLLDVWPLGRLKGMRTGREAAISRNVRRSVIEKLPFFALALAAGAITLLSHQRTADLGVFEDFTPFQGLLFVFYKPVFYLGKLFVPASLSPCYEPPQPFALTHPLVLASVAVLTLLTVAVVALRRRSPAGWVGLAILIAGLAPTLGLVQYSWVILSDKYLYVLPLLGPLFLATALLDRAFANDAAGRARARRHAAAIICLLALGGLFAATRAQWSNWRDTVTLYRHMIARTPQVALLHSNLALEYERLGRIDEALRAHEQAVRLRPGRTEYHGNLASALLRAGRPEQAIAEYEKALPENPRAAAVHASVADALITLGRYDEAFARLDEALRLDPRLASAHNNRGRALTLLGRTEEARASFEQAVAYDPLQFTALGNLGGLLAREGRYAEAVAYFERALAVNPSFVEAHGNLALSLAALGRTGEAERHFKEALRLRADFLPALLGYGELLLAQNRRAEAERTFSDALRLQPANRAAVTGLRRARARASTD